MINDNIFYFLCVGWVRSRTGKNVYTLILFSFLSFNLHNKYFSYSYWKIGFSSIYIEGIVVVKHSIFQWDNYLFLSGDEREKRRREGNYVKSSHQHGSPPAVPKTSLQTKSVVYRTGLGSRSAVSSQALRVANLTGLQQSVNTNKKSVLKMSSSLKLDPTSKRNVYLIFNVSWNSVLYTLHTPLVLFPLVLVFYYSFDRILIILSKWIIIIKR